MNVEPLIPKTSPRSSTGIEGLDNILGEGLPKKRLYLIRGKPGTGKTTLALQFLMEGRRLKETCLYVTLSETKEELETVAQSHGWTLNGLNLIELSNVEQAVRSESQTTLLHPSEAELGRTARLIETEVDRVKPQRVVLDSLSELRLLSQNPLRYRRQILAFKTFFATRNCTVLFLDDDSSDASDQQMDSISHGVIELDQLRPEYGAERRRLSVLKLRGVQYRGGFHDYIIRTGGLEVYPRLIAAEHHSNFIRESITSNITALDKLLGGGLDRGTSSLFIGPAGCGKSTLAVQYAVAAAARGEVVGFFMFDENIGTLHARTQGIGTDIEPLVKAQKLRLQQVDPAELAPGEFTSIVRRMVEKDKARMIVIDSLNGYLNAMPDERFLLIQLHELLTFLAQRGVVTILTMAQHGLIGNMQSPVDLTYLADSVIMLRYFEFEGAIKKAISVIKKRSGGHEETIREFALTKDQGVRVGEPLKQFRGVLTGIPTFSGAGASIMKDEHAGRAN